MSEPSLTSVPPSRLVDELKFPLPLSWVNQHPQAEVILEHLAIETLLGLLHPPDAFFQGWTIKPASAFYVPRRRW